MKTKKHLSVDDVHFLRKLYTTSNITLQAETNTSKVSGDIVATLFSSQLTNGPNKLECLYQADFFSLV
jgi:hypothetical protein